MKPIFKSIYLYYGTALTITIILFSVKLESKIERRTNSLPIQEAGAKMEFGISEAWSLRNGTDLSVLKVELVENITNLGLQRVLARRDDGILFSAIATQNDINTGDRVVFVDLANKSTVRGGRVQHIFLARKIQ